MGPGARKGLAFAGSTVFHVGLLAWGAFGYTPEFDVDFDIELTDVELLDPDALQAEAPAPAEPEPVAAPPKPEPPKPQEPAAKPEPPKKPEEPKKEEPKDKRDLGNRGTNVDQLGPVSSTFYMLLVPKKIRSLSYADKARAIMSTLPDYKFLIGGSGLDALKDFDHLVIASSDLRDLTQTFIAVDYKMSRDKMKAKLESGFAAAEQTVEWIEEDGVLRGNPRPIDESEVDDDPRWIVLLEDNIAVYVREEFLPHVLGDEEATDAPTSGNYVANLAKLRRFAARQPTTGMQVVIKDLRGALKRVRGLPFQPPDRIELSVEATEEPELLARLEWPDVVETKAFELWYKNDLAKFLDGNLKAKPFKWMVYDQVEQSRKDKDIELWARFETDQATMILGIIADVTSQYMEQLAERQSAAKKRRQQKKDAQAPSGGASDADAPTGKPARKPEPPPKPDPTTEPTPDVPKSDPGASPPQGSGL